MSPVGKRKTAIAAGYGAGLLLGIVAFGAGLAAWMLTAAAWGVALAVVAILALMVLAMVVGVAWMRTIDEAAREAHKSAWYWGGSAGLAVGGVGIMLALLPQAAEVKLPMVIADRADPAAYMANGAFYLMMLMILGYGVAWAWWWLWRGR